MNLARGRRRRQGRARRRRCDTAPISLLVPGRLQVVDHDPLTIYDGAHNAPGIAALAQSVPEGTVAVLSVLDDKDAAEMLRALLPRLSAAVFTRAPNPRALSPATLADLAQKVGATIPTEIEPDPRKAVSRAQEHCWRTWNRARDRLHLPRRRPAQRSGRAQGERAVNEGGPSVIAMIALVAVVVAARHPDLLRHRLRASGAPSCDGAAASPTRLPGHHMNPMFAIFRIEDIKNEALQTAANVALLVLARPLSRPDLLDVRGCAPADRRPAAGRLRHAGELLPVHRDDRLPDRPPAGVPRRRAPARARDDRRRGAPGEPGLHALPALRLRGPDRTICAVRAACASSRSAATRARSRSTRPGASARSARPRRARRRRRPPRASPAPPDDRSVDGRGRHRAARARRGWHRRDVTASASLTH